VSKSPPARQLAAENDRADELLMQRALIALPLVTIAGVAAGGYFMGPPVAVLVLAAGVLLAAIAAFWSSIRALFGQTPLSREDAFALGAPSAEEEQKRAVLRAIKDLEFEHGVGKISDDDYRDLLARYRDQAKRLLRVIDDAALPERNKVEALVAAHLKKEGIAALSKTAPDESDVREEPEEPEEPEERDDDSDADKAATSPCGVCNTDNDVDAVFCKKCGTRLDDDDDDDEEDAS
jgi:hypothetical protein